MNVCVGVCVVCVGVGSFSSLSDVLISPSSESINDQTIRANQRRTPAQVKVPVKPSSTYNCLARTSRQDDATCNQFVVKCAGSKLLNFEQSPCEPRCKTTINREQFDVDLGQRGADHDAKRHQLATVSAVEFVLQPLEA